MNTSSSNTANPSDNRRAYAWLLFPLSIFPLLALLTYDWHSIAALSAPPAPHTNWIGALGDYFAYYGYLYFGMAIWILPLLCIAGGLSIALGRHMHFGRRPLWFAVFMVASSGLVQVLGTHGGFIAHVTRHYNIAAPGGAIGYLTMTRFLSPLVSDFASAIIATCLLLVAIIGTLGAHNLANAAMAILHWATAGRHLMPSDASSDDEDWQNELFGDTNHDSNDNGNDRYRAALLAKEAAKREREAEKQRIRDEKLRAKEEKLRLKEEAKLAKLADKSAPTANAQVADDGSTSDTANSPYILPPMSMLAPLKHSTADHSDVGEMSQRLIDTLKLFNVDAEMSFTVQGPVVTKYAVKLEPGTRYQAVTNLQDNLMGALHAKSLRIEAPIPGKEEVGIEVPNRAPAGISFREIIESDAWRNFHGELPLLFGKDASGKELIADLASMPHMLVAGATGQGKSVCLNAIINGLLMTKTPEQLKLIMVDPKSVEFTSYVSIPHLIVPIITENKKVVFSLHWAVAEMEKRLKLFARAKVRNIYDFNHRPNFTQTDMFGDDLTVGGNMPRTVPYIVIIIDEVADLMASNGKEVTPDIARLTAKARAAGIHLILATQRPDAKIITGAIKANVPGRVAFKTATAIDSRTILDDTGAENLIGRGDMLFKGKDNILIRAQGAWISDPEIANITKFIEEHSKTDFDDRFTKKLDTIKEEEIDLFADDGAAAEEAKAEAVAKREQVKAEENASDFKKAVECIINTNRASTSHFQRKLGWGYNHSAKIMDMLEDAGIIGPQSGAGPRQIIMDQNQLLEVFNGNPEITAETQEVNDDSIRTDA